MGGAASYTAEQRGEVHQRMGISDDDFTETMRLLKDTLEEFGIKRADAAAVLDRYEQTRASIVATAS